MNYNFFKRSCLLALSTAMVVSLSLTGDVEASPITAEFDKLINDGEIGPYTAPADTISFGAVTITDVTLTASQTGLANSVQGVQIDLQTFDLPENAAAVRFLLNFDPDKSNLLSLFGDPIEADNGDPNSLPTNDGSHVLESFQAAANSFKLDLNPNANSNNGVFDILFDFSVRNKTIGPNTAVSYYLFLRDETSITAEDFKFDSKLYSGGNWAAGMFVQESTSDGGSAQLVADNWDDPKVAPEPTSIALLGLGGLLTTFGVRRRKQKRGSSLSA